MKTNQAPGSLKWVVAASFVGTLFEWYDFFLYGAAAALVFGKLFFPTLDPATAVLASFATFAVGFLARPLGGIVMGYVGDRFGRRVALVSTLVLMGTATCLIGLLPSYGTAGIYATASLVVLRLLQGFGVGGEWGGAVLLIVESAPESKRGFYGSIAQLGVPCGMGLASIAMAAFAGLSEQEFLDWGWRVPFLFSALLVLVGIVLRLRVAESPEFMRLRASKPKPHNPIRALFSRAHLRSLLQGTGARIAENGAFYLFSTFIIAYATQNLELSRQTILLYITIAITVDIITIPFFGWLADKVGARAVYISGAVFTACIAFPFFWLAHSGSTSLLQLALILGLSIGHAAMYAPQAAYLVSLFPPEIRYSGISLASQLASILAGALAPTIASLLLHAYGYWAISTYLLVMCGITLTALLTRPAKRVYYHAVQ